MEKLEISVDDRPEQQAAVFRLKGAVDVFSYKDLKAAFDLWSKERFRPKLLLDLSGVSYVGSSGWSVIFLQSTTQDRDGAIALFGMSDRVRRSLDIIMPRKRHLQTAGNEAEAFKVLAEAKPTPVEAPSN